MFILNFWGGNVLDRYIIEYCGFLDIVKFGDEVMVDRGFLIRDLLLERRVILNILLFIKKCLWGKGKYFIVYDVLKIKKIVKFCIYVEWVIGRLKNYKILFYIILFKIKFLCN